MRTRIATGELVREIARKTGISQNEVKTVIEAFEATVLENLRVGNAVTLRGFGTFKPVVKKGGVRRNPRTGESVQVPTKVVLKFQPNEKVKILKIIK